MEDNIIVGERIRKIREALKMNREKFSEMIDISDVFLGQIERGERSLSTKTLVKIVKFTGLSADFILFGDESSNTTIAEINRILNKCSDSVLISDDPLHERWSRLKSSPVPAAYSPTAPWTVPSVSGF